MSATRKIGTYSLVNVVPVSGGTGINYFLCQSKDEASRLQQTNVAPRGSKFIYPGHPHYDRLNGRVGGEVQLPFENGMVMHSIVAIKEPSQDTKRFLQTARPVFKREFRHQPAA